MTAPAFEYKTKPWEHQRRALQFSARRKAFALFMDPGTGKSMVVLANAAWLYQQGEIDQLLILAPNGVHEQWIQDEVPKHLPDWCPRSTLIYRSLAYKAKQKAAAFVETAPGLQILAINLEVISRKPGAEFVRGLMKGKKTFLALDEGQMIKTPSADRTRNAWALSRAAAYKRLLNGIPVSEGLQDLYAQMRFIDPAVLGFNTYAEFKAAHCIMVGPFNTIKGYRDEDGLKAKIAPHSFSCSKYECLDLPPQTWVRRVVPLSQEQLEIYHALRDQFVAETPGGILIADHALTRLTRLQQVLAGHVPLNADPLGLVDIEDTGYDWRPLPCPRIDAALELIEQAPRKVLLWTRFRPDIEMLGAALKEKGIGYARYYGGLTAAECSEELARFRTDPGVKVLLGTRRKGGRGLTINEADMVVNYTHVFSYEQTRQAEDRNHRGGQALPVTYYDLVALRTVDERVLSVIRSKAEVASQFRQDGGLYRKWILDAPESV